MGTWNVYKNITVTQAQAMYILCNTSPANLILWGSDGYDLTRIPEITIKEIQDPSYRITNGFRFTGLVRTMARWESGNYRTESVDYGDNLGGYVYNQDILDELEAQHGSIVDWVYCRNTDDQNVTLTIYTDGLYYGIDSGDFNAVPVVKYEDGAIQQLQGYGSAIWVTEPSFVYNVLHDGRTETATGDYGTNGTIGRFTYSDWLIQQSNFEILADKPFAKTMTDAEEYLEDGDTDHLSGGGFEPEPIEEIAEDREVVMYYESDIYKRNYNSSTSTRVGASTIHFTIQYKNEMGEEIVNPYRSICGYVASNNEPNDDTRFGNIIWVANNNINLIKTEQNLASGGFVVSKTIPTYSKTTGFYPPYIDSTTIYDARYRTNMRIFANEQDARDFLSGGNPTPIGESGNQFNPNGFIGDKTVFNDGHDMAGGGMSSCWIMNESQLEDLANVFTTGLTTVEEQNDGVIINVTKTCARAFASHGEPIDAVVDLFWIPFDPSEFITSGRSSFQIGRDDLASATSLIKLLTQSGDTVIAHGNRSIGKSNEFVGNVVDSIGDMFENTTQKVKNVSE